MNLTDEQRAALEATCRIFQAAIDGEKGKPLTEQVALLVGINSTIGLMLNQSYPAWQITEERKIALRQVLTSLIGGQPNDLQWDARAIAILEDMLAEGKI
jgi:hypothetical protein